MDQLSLLETTRAARAASGFKDVNRVWLKCRVRECRTVISPDIGTDFQIFLRRFTEIVAHLEGCAPRPAEWQVTQRPGKGESELEFQRDGFEFIDP